MCDESIAAIEYLPCFFMDFATGMEDLGVDGVIVNDRGCWKDKELVVEPVAYFAG